MKVRLSPIVTKPKNPCKCGQVGNFVSIPLQESQDRPHFQCQNCKSTWSSGKLGGVFSQYLVIRGKRVYNPR